MKHLFAMLLLGAGFAGHGQDSGCGHPHACNYDADAIHDNDLCWFTCNVGCANPLSCAFSEENLYHDGSCDDVEGCGIFVQCGILYCEPLYESLDYDGDGWPDVPLLGCTDCTAANYAYCATEDDGSCYPVVLGCTLPFACNFNEEANRFEYDSCDFWSCYEGCTDETACNYDAEALSDDGSCLDCDLFANRCLDGTIWSEELQGCVVANPSDTDFDSCVGMTDLLNLLSVFGTCAEPDLDEWTCGEPVGYQGYDYSTVLIGEQCWFAENLRAEAYANGDEIASQLSESDWEGIAAGATAVYGDGDLTCYDYAPELDACGPGQALSTFGRVYNWHSAVDERGLCPGGWQVPSDWDWSVMEQAIGMAPNEAESSGWRGANEGAQLKSQIGWSSGNGTDNWFFNGLPAGHRHHSGNHFDAAGNAALFWTATELDSERAWFRILSHSESRIQRTPDFKTYGCSVRCIKDPQ